MCVSLIRQSTTKLSLLNLLCLRQPLSRPTTTMATSKNVSLKLLIDTKANKVLFAEAGKDFVDFLFNLLSLSVGTVTRILTKHSMVGCLGNLYDSIENLNNTYLQPNQNKDSLLKSIRAAQLPLLLTGDISPDKKFYICKSFHHNVADDPNAVCPNCKHYMSTEVSYIAPKAGFVKEVVTYMVMDDLAVKPMSNISSISLLNEFSVKEVGALQERVVYLGMDEGLKLLKASLQSKTVLTSVLLCNFGA